MTKPIIMQAESVRAILDGRKVMTRRVVKGIRIRPEIYDGTMWATKNEDGWSPVLDFCPYQVGVKLWVRETFTGDWRGNGIPARGCINYRADGEIPELYRDNAYWRPSIYMPKWASRITLEITGIKVERVSDISEADAIAEGVWTATPELMVSGITKNHIGAYRKLWDSINGARGYGWDTAPWVWCLSFRRVSE